MSNTNEPGRKIEAKYENPIDNVLIALSDKVSPFFKNLNFTPNGLTTLSTIFSTVSLYELYYKNTTNFTIYTLLAYFFDVMDGYYARKYNMSSKTGDQYDHYKDWVTMAIGAYILYTRYNITNFPILLIVLAVLYFLGLVYTGCQEVLTEKKNQYETLAFTKNLTIDETTCKQQMGILRWFGHGSMAIFSIIAVLYINGDLNSSGVVPGTGDLFDDSPNCCGDSKGIVSPFDDSPLENLGPIGSIGMIETFGPQRMNTDLVDALKNFGTVRIGSDLGTSSLGTSSLGSYDPYSTNEMVGRLFRD